MAGLSASSTTAQRPNFAASVTTATAPEAVVSRRRMSRAAHPNIIRQAKGNRDRIVELPCELAEEIRVQILRARAVAESDRLNGVPVPSPAGSR